MTLPARSRRILLPWGVLGVVVLCPACQKGPRYYPVHGQVFLDGQPAEGALVVFHPAADPGPQALRPFAYVQADGSFTLRTYSPADGTTTDGAPPGDYLVAINWFPPNVRDYRSVIPDKLQGRYGDPKTSGLRAQVREEPNELPPFQLTLKKRERKDLP